MRFRATARLARNWLPLFAVLATLPSCLITGSPDFEEPAATRPILTVVAPAVTELLRVNEFEGTFPIQQFSVQVASEDAGQNLDAVLLLDYGVTREVGEDEPQPYRRIINPRDVPAASLSDPPRLLTIPYLPTLETSELTQCHSVTMMVVRNRYKSSPYSWCPTDDQFATVTWFMSLCKGDATACSYLDCPIKGEAVYTYCPNPDDLAQLGGGT